MTRVLYSLLYLPLAALIAPCLLAGIKLARTWRRHSRGEVLRVAGVIVVLALVAAGYAAMVFSRGRDYRVALLLNSAAFGLNFFRMARPSKIKTWIAAPSRPVKKHDV